MLRIGIIAFVVAIVACPASGQTTQPSEKTPPTAPVEQAWPRAVESLAKALSKGDAAAAETVLSTRATMHGFESQQMVEVAALLQRLANSTLVGRHAYLRPPLAMAADIGADFKNAASIPEKSKFRFLVEEESDMKRANATAAQWVVEQLDARGGVPVGVIVLWTPRPARVGSAESDATVFDVVFVLCRGEEVAPHEFKITSLVFGNPLPL